MAFILVSRFDIWEVASAAFDVFSSYCGTSGEPFLPPLPTLLDENKFSLVAPRRYRILPMRLLYVEVDFGVVYRLRFPGMLRGVAALPRRITILS